MSAIDNRRDLLLLLLYSPGRTLEFNEPISGRTRLVKMLFLFKEEVHDFFKKNIKINEQDFYKFFPWTYGPFSSDVYDDLTFFILRDFISNDKSDEDIIPQSVAEWSKWSEIQDESDSEPIYSDYSEEQFKLTPKGVEFAKKLYQNLTPSQKNNLQIFKKKYLEIPLRAILQYVYENYPLMTSESVIKDDL